MATGHIRKRTSKQGDVRYQLIVEGEKDPVTGKRDRQFKTVRCTKKQAEALLRKMIDDVETGNIVSPSTIKLGDWLHQWLDTYLPNIEATTRAGYKGRIDTSIIPYLGHIPINALKADNIQNWVNSLTKKGLAPKTIKNAFLNVKAALDKAVVLRMLPFNPCAGVVLPKLQKKYQGNVYSPAEMNEIVRLAKGTDMFPILLLATHLGLRRGEVIALQWADIDFKQKTVHICRNTTMVDSQRIEKAPKTQAGIRDFALADNTAAALKQLHREYLQKKLAYGPGFVDSNLVVCKEDGSGYRPDSITQKWERFVKQHNLPPARFHDLRHSCATAMIQAGVDPKTVQAKLGHADISVTMNIYTHMTIEMNKAAADTMNSVLTA